MLKTFMESTNINKKRTNKNDFYLITEKNKGK